MAFDTITKLAPHQPILRSPELREYLTSNAVFGDTLRFRQLDRYQAHYRGLQYAGLQKDWWGLTADTMETVSPSVQVPNGYEQPQMGLNVRQRRPTAPLNLSRLIVDRFTGLLFSEDRKPDVIVENDDQTEDWMHAVLEQSKFWSAMRMVRASGGGCGSALATCHVRKNQFHWDVHDPKHCQFFWRNRATYDLGGVLIMYRHVVDQTVTDRKTGQQRVEAVEYLYRRIITEEEDTVYQPVRLEQGVQIQWEDPPDEKYAGTVIQQRVMHGLGFFPGAWIQNLPDGQNEDGVPDCEGAWQLMDTIDRLNSQINKGALANLDPTVVLKVEQKLVAAGFVKGSDNALRVGAAGDAKYMEITGTGIEVARKLVGDFHKAVCEVARFVQADPDKLSGAAQSAKAIELLFAPMLEKADDLRAQYGDGIVRLLQIAERIARHVGPEAIILPPKMVQEDAGDGTPRYRAAPRMLGPGGYIRLRWGPYFPPTVQDLDTTTKILVSANGQLIDEETAVRTFCRELGIRDPGTVLRKLRVEKKERLDEAMAGMFETPSGAPVPGKATPTAAAPAQLGAQHKNPDEAPGPPAGQGGRP